MTIKMSKRQEKIYATKTRRQWCEDIDNCDAKFKSQLACKMNVEFPQQLIDDIMSVVESRTYVSTGGLDVSDLPRELHDRVSDAFNMFQEDVYATSIMMIKSNENMYTHLDPVRNTSVYLQMSPANKYYTPIELYANTRMYCIPLHDTPTVYGWNTKIPHAVFNKSKFDRYNLQLSSKMKYEEFFKKYKEYFIF